MVSELSRKISKLRIRPNDDDITDVRKDGVN